MAPRLVWGGAPGRAACAEALLRFEDTDISRCRAVVDERVGSIRTGDFLRALETGGLIQSSGLVLDQAAAMGRNVERQRLQTTAPETLQRFRDPLSDRPDG